MEITNIWMKEADNNLYIEKEGKLYRTSVTPYRAISENELEEIKSPLSNAMYIKMNHLFKPSESFFQHDLAMYGLKIK